MCASGWGQGENHHTQMAYLRTCISEEIRTAIDFDNIRTVNNALFQIKDYEKFRDAAHFTTNWVVAILPASGSESISNNSDNHPVIQGMWQILHYPWRSINNMSAQHNPGEVCPHQGSGTDNRDFNLGTSLQLKSEDIQHIEDLGQLQTNKNPPLRYGSWTQGLPHLWQEGAYGCSLHHPQRKVPV